MRENRLALGNGDKADLMLDGEACDVKGNCRTWDNRWYYNFYCGVMVDEWERKIAESSISRFIFTQVDPDYQNARILGTISKFDFSEKFTYKEFGGHDRMVIISRQLTPIRKALLHI